MSCNPSIGGIGKGHLVKEVDALGGAMALATDEAGIQFRILNSSKGRRCARRARRPTGCSTSRRSAARLENQPNLTLFQQAVDDLMLEGDARRRRGHADRRSRFAARAVVLTAGTFLAGLIHVGLEHYQAGRAGDPPAMTLAARLRELKLPVGRLKTGTPPRLDGRTHRFLASWTSSRATIPSRCSPSSGARDMHPRQLPCWITHTNERTHEIIRGGLDRSPMFTGVIEGVGPRYCPSIEDKIHRFAGKAAHQIFLEPEGLTTHEIYPNGISTSLPFDVQLALVRSIRGLRARAHPAPRLRDRVRLLRSARAEVDARDQGDRAACSSPARSTARPATKKRRRRACSPASTRRLQRAGEDGWCPRRDEAYLGRAGRRPDHARRDRAVPHVHQPRRIPPAAARGQRGPAADRDRARARRRSTMRAGMRSAASATRSRARPSG